MVRCKIAIAALASLAGPTCPLALAADPPPSGAPAAATTTAGAPVAPEGRDDLGALDIEDLLRVKVISVSKRLESFAKSPAALSVIKGEAIRRSGATSLPDALRMAPGIQVMRVESSGWTVASRGLFTSILNANDVLALIDGRSIYSTSVNGRVIWSENDVLLEDVDRIEVVRGPGGSLWGANAVNGVINVVTKLAKETQGAYASAGGGTPVEQGFGAVRYGGAISEDAHYRVYAKYANRGSFETPDGRGAHDHWWMLQGGARVDWEPSDDDLVTVSGDAYASELAKVIRTVALAPPFSEVHLGTRDQAGGNVTARWTRDLGDDAEVVIQAWVNHTSHEDEPDPLLEYGETTFDLEAQHRLRLLDRHEFTWGGGYRLVRDIVNRRGAIFVRADPSGGVTHMGNVFAQDRIALVPDALFLTLGAKVEHNRFTGFEVQPTVRLAWTPVEGYTLWGAVSRAVVIPPRVSGVHGRLNVDAGPGTLVTLTGADQPRGQDLIAYEGGLRLHPLESVLLDVAGFVHRHDDLQTSAQAAPRPDPDFPGMTQVPIIDTFDARGETFGVEVEGRFDVTTWLRVAASYSFLRTDLRLRAGSAAIDGDDDERGSPRDQAQARVSLDLPGRVECDAWLRYVDRISAQDVPSYVELDVRIAWRPVESLELSVVGQNLLHESHLEGRALPGADKEVPRGVYGAVTIRF
jgi:iron complex outermembrane receptor protein